MDVNRHVLTVDLRDDPETIETYVQYHQHAWPEVLESLRRAGVRAMDIYLLGRRLVMMVELEEGRDLRQTFGAHMAGGPRVAEWERLMKSLQQPAPGAAAGDWWSAMAPVFHLDRQHAAGGRISPGLRTS